MPKRITYSGQFISEDNSTDPLCPICQQEAETTEHTLLLCPWTAQLWQDNSLVVHLARSKQVHLRGKTPANAPMETPALRLTQS